MYYRPVKQTTDTTARINITDFRRYGFLQPGRTVEGTATIHGVTIKARSESVETLILNYTWQGVDITQRIGIITKPSNLAGELLFFTCPGTAKPCRLIYQTIGNLYGFSVTIICDDHFTTKRNDTPRHTRQRANYLHTKPL